jgi:hypothetical protein
VTCVIFPVKIRLPVTVTQLLYRTFVVLRLCDYTDPPKRWHISLSLETAPLVGVLLLLATTTIDGSVIRLGIAGENGVRPYDVLALFIILVRIFLLHETRALHVVDFSLFVEGLHCHCLGLHWRLAFSRILGRTERRIVRTQASFLSLLFFLYLWCNIRQRESMAQSTLNEADQRGALGW